MPHSTRSMIAALPALLLIGSFAAAQQQPTAPGVAQALPPMQPPPGFQLNQVQQAQLNQVLDTWQQESGRINTFKCSFERLEYDVAFGPGQNIPLNRNKGELSFSKPDKGSFQITEINTWQAAPPQAEKNPGGPLQGTWVPQPNAIGEHWVCDGKSVFEYRHDQKQLVERPIPASLQGKAIVDGPLPFLFGAEAAKLKARYWMRIDPSPDPNQVWLVALPKLQAQAADFKQVDVILDRQRLLPTHIQVHLPNGSRHVYAFALANDSVNSRLAILQSLFDRPRVPAGWKRIVEQMPVEQAAQPALPPR